MRTKLVAIPNITIGNTVINYIIEYYKWEGRWMRKSYLDIIVTPEELKDLKTKVTEFEIIN